METVAHTKREAHGQMCLFLFAVNRDRVCDP